MDPVRVGVIGVGAFGTSHVVAYKSLPYVSLAAVCDVNAARAQEFAARYQIPHWYSQYDELLNDELDAVSVTTPEDAHLAPVLAALSADKHVLVEKPIATRLEEARQMLMAARASRRFLMPGHILRFETRYAMVKERLAAGELGRLVGMSARRNRAKSLAETYLRTHGILEASIHDLDILLWYAGDTVKRVHAVQRHVFDHANPDATWALLEFKGGAVATIENLWLNPDQAGIGQNDALQVTGTRGIAHIDFVNSGLSLWRDEGYIAPDVSYEPRVRGEMFGALKEELAYFTRCVLENRAPEVVTAEDGVQALEVALAIIESAAEGRDVVL
jgi:predicted dehydrogenase